MKLPHYLVILLLGFFSLSLEAAKPTVYTYKGEVAGVTCSACSKRVKHALSTLDGVSKVSVKVTVKPGQASFEVESTSPDLTLEMAQKALGDAADSYNFLTFQKTAP